LEISEKDLNITKIKVLKNLAKKINIIRKQEISA
jgi:hypothetical protein